MNYVDFSNNYFDKAVVALQDSFTRGIRNTYFKNSLEGLLRQIELDTHWTKLKKLRKDC